VGFVVDKIVLETDLLWVLRFPLPILISTDCSTLIIIIIIICQPELVQRAK
jgi:hypothetical protein